MMSSFEEVIGMSLLRIEKMIAQIKLIGSIIHCRGEGIKLRFY
jgi:hypothetical protein